MDFAIHTALDQPTGVFAAHGELDIFSAHAVATGLRTALARGCSRIVIDVAGVSFVDASALGVLARAHACVAAEGATLEFVAPSTQFQQLCALTSLDRVFELAD